MLLGRILKNGLEDLKHLLQLSYVQEGKRLPEVEQLDFEVPLRCIFQSLENGLHDDGWEIDLSLQHQVKGDLGAVVFDTQNQQLLEPLGGKVYRLDCFGELLQVIDTHVHL